MRKKETIESIYQLYMQDLYRYLLSLCRNKHVAEDLLQDTFYKAYIHLELFRGAEFKPWLFKIAYHTYIDWQRKEKSAQAVEQGILEGYISVGLNSAEDDYFQQYKIETWLDWTEQLNWQQRHTLILRDFYDFTYDEISELLDMSLSAVKVSIYRGRKYIQKRMKEEKQ
ncbi:MAG TPA: RNA polymerase sigma factor [Bacilli bacterium]|nr:RNA polymerase sigma factor [Bacilli bacterium]